MDHFALLPAAERATVFREAAARSLETGINAVRTESRRGETAEHSPARPPLFVPPIPNGCQHVIDGQND